MSLSSNRTPSPPWARRWLWAAGIYNLSWGILAIAWPHILFDLTGAERINYPEIWQCVGMIVGVYGIGYLIAASDSRTHWPIVLVGLLGKVFGPIGFLAALLRGTFPPLFGLTILTNDLLWWIPFAMILWDAAKHQRKPRPSGRPARESRSPSDDANSGRTNVAKLEVGDHAPDFSATTSDGNMIRLADFLGKRALVLFFYPKDGTPICTQEACAFRDSYEQFVAAGADVIGVSGDTEESHRTFARQHKLSFPLISDVDGSLRKAFAVPKTMGLFPGRVTYVIDQEGIIRQIFSAQFASDKHVRQALIAVGAASRSSQ